MEKENKIKGHYYTHFCHIDKYFLNIILLLAVSEITEKSYNNFRNSAHSYMSVEISDAITQRLLKWVINNYNIIYRFFKDLELLYFKF